MPKLVDEAASSGTHLELMEAMRDRLADAVADPDCPKRDLASLSRRLQDIAEKIDSIKERNRQEAREDNPCPKCGGTGVASGSRSGAATTNQGWRPHQ